LGKIVSYELQTYRTGAWKIDSIFDDRELALFEAKRMAESRRHSGIRVVQEEFDEDTNETATRVLYRSSAVFEANQEIMEKRAEARREVAEERAKKPPLPKRNGRAQPPQRDSTFSLALVLTAGSILLLGIAAMMALHYVAALL
jgi:hypothetical protein